MSKLTIAMIALLASGCLNRSGSDADRAAVDADGDGSQPPGDCDDQDPSVRPGAPELCNGIDDDCDGRIDEDAADAPIWYGDLDSDGYGDPEKPAQSCTPPEGAVADATDCDDSSSITYPGAPESPACTDGDGDGIATDRDCDGVLTIAPDADGDGYQDGCLDCDDDDAGVHPDAAESCNGIDDDCDGFVDEATASDASTWYLDADSDGFGDPDAPVIACAAPAGHVDDGSDCDDSLANVNPAATERCNGRDDDCDLQVDEDDASDATSWSRDGDGDGYGDDCIDGDCDWPYTACAPRDPADLGTLGDCDDASPSVNPAASETCNGIDDDCANGVDDGLVFSDWFGDGDGDGFGDVLDAVSACASVPGRSDDSSDCDDSDPTVNPAASETCNEIDDDCANGVDDGLAFIDWFADGDGDGFGDALDVVSTCGPVPGRTVDGSDCDDLDPTVNPAASETCNGIDDDCDVLTDEPGSVGEEPQWPDADGDGYGADDGDPATTPDATCSGPGLSAIDGDCDDADDTVHPAAPDVCNGVDDDCDGEVDEPAATAWYADTDSDGYGDPGSSVLSCPAPVGYVASAGDCDDGDGSAYPGATEWCDVVDQDCDGLFDDPDSADASTWYADADADGFGDPNAPSTACASPPGAVADGTDCDDSLDSIHQGAREVCGDGVDDDCDGLAPGCAISGQMSLATTGFKLIGETDGDVAGVSVAHAGDVNGDGFGDVLVGAHGADGAGVDEGAAYLVLGPVLSDLDLSLAAAKWTGEAAGDSAGFRTDGLGDVDSDGYGDVLVSAGGASSGLGAVYVLHGPQSGVSDLGAAAAARLLGESAGWGTGSGAAPAGDVNGDGVLDLIVGAEKAAPAGIAVGTAYVALGPFAGDISLSTAAARLDGSALYDFLGCDVSGAGDTNGDGLDDVIIGAKGVDDGGVDAGAAYLLLSPPSGTYTPTSADAALIGEEAGDLAGRAVAAAGDTDGDGYADVLVGASSNDEGGPFAGAAYLVRGPVPAALDLSLADARFIGEVDDDVAGTDVAGAGDLDGDGLDDVVVSASELKLPWDGAFDYGRVYLLLGPLAGTVDLSSADAEIEGEAAEDAAGGSVDGGGDVDADGWPDLLVGALHNDEGADVLFGVSSGAAYVLYGGGL